MGLNWSSSEPMRFQTAFVGFSSTMRRLASSLNRRRLPGSVTTVGAGFSTFSLSGFGLSILGLSELGLELGPELGLSRGYRPHRAFGPTASSRFS